MTKEEAIKVLTVIKGSKEFIQGFGTKYNNDIEAIDMAIKSLQEPKTIIGIDVPYGSDKGVVTIFKGKDEQLILKEVKEIMAVVRCKDCIHWTEEKDEEDDILYGWCKAPFENDNLLVYGDDATRIFTAYDFFCKSGERREE